MDAQEHLQAGQLDEAIQAVIAEVKSQPTNYGHRAFFAELLCLSCDLERADNQLDTLATQAPEYAVQVSLFRQLIRAETARQAFFNEGAVPEVLDEPTAAIKSMLEASVCLRENNPAAALELLNQAQEQQPRIHGQCDGQTFEDFRDMDDLTAHVFEVLTSTGKYYWIPLERVELVEFRPLETVRDLVWRPAHMVVTGGPDGEVYLPVLYPGSHQSDDNQIRLGRATDWRGEEGEPIRGLGQKTYLVGDEDRPLLSLNELTFDRTE